MLSKASRPIKPGNLPVPRPVESCHQHLEILTPTLGVQGVSLTPHLLRVLTWKQICEARHWVLIFHVARLSGKSHLWDWKLLCLLNRALPNQGGDASESQPTLQDDRVGHLWNKANAWELPRRGLQYVSNRDSQRSPYCPLYSDWEKDEGNKRRKASAKSWGES